MGGSGGSYGGSEAPDEDKKVIRETREKTQNAEYEANVNEMINNRLNESNKRDADTTQDRLDEVKQIIQNDLGQVIDLRFGGSVRKRTYVEGLSDTDVLILIDNTDLINKSPRYILEYVKQILLDEHINNVSEIRTGRLAITITYNDGSEIQLLPAIRSGAGYKIPSQEKNDWSNVIKPEKFAERLTEVNQNNRGKVVPIIKLVKGINSQLPEKHQLSSYHIESLAIEVFKSCPESCNTTKSMLEYFFEKSKELVKSKIKDKTGQSINVDEYLGSDNSKERYRMSYILDNIYRRMINADEIGSVEEWETILGD